MNDGMINIRIYTSVEHKKLKLELEVENGESLDIVLDPSDVDRLIETFDKFSLACKVIN